MDVEIDNLTLVLLGALVVLLLYDRFSGATPLVHPLLLSQQAAPASVRQPNETAVYRAWATGQGTPLQVRPAGLLKTVGDVVRVPTSIPRPGKPALPITQPFILDTPLTTEALTEVVRLVPLGLKALFPSQMDGTVAAPKPIAVLLPPSPGTSLPLLLLSIASRPYAPLVVLPHPKLLSTALRSAAHPTPRLLVVHASLLRGITDEELEDLAGAEGILIVGDPGRECRADLAKVAARGVVVRWWEQLWDAAETQPQETDGERRQPSIPLTAETTHSDVHSYFYSLPDGAPVSEVVVHKLEHMNFTAGIAGLLSIFPADKRPSPALNDVVGSTVRLDTPFGMTIALTSVWGGAGFRLIGPAGASWDTGVDIAAEIEQLALSDQPVPTVLFLSPAHHAYLLSHAHAALMQHPLGRLAARHQLRDVRAGYVARSGMLDSAVWKGVRNATGVAGDNARAIIVVGEPSAAVVARSHALLSLPLSRVHATPASAGPVFATHFNDLQSTIVPNFWKRASAESKEAHAHSGPPASNIEVMLRGPGAEPEPSAAPAPPPGTTAPSGSQAAPLAGRVFIRGPAVAEVLGASAAADGWTDTGVDAGVRTNGTFVVG